MYSLLVVKRTEVGGVGPRPVPETAGGPLARPLASDAWVPLLFMASGAAGLIY